MRSFMLDGDVYDPSGTMSGGAAPSGSGVLVHVQELCAVEECIAAAWRMLAELECEVTCHVVDKWRERERVRQKGGFVTIIINFSVAK